LPGSTASTSTTSRGRSGELPTAMPAATNSRTSAWRSMAASNAATRDLTAPGCTVTATAIGWFGATSAASNRTVLARIIRSHPILAK
jgi:hypothetical protein